MSEYTDWLNSDSSDPAQLVSEPTTGVLDTLLTPITFALHVLDTPASVVRSVLAGDPGRGIEGIFNPDQRVSGREVLDSLGLIDKNTEGILPTIAGIATEIATDPLLLVGSLGGLTRSGKAVAETTNLVKNIEIHAAQAAAGDEISARLLPKLTATRDQAFKRLRTDALERIAKAGESLVPLDPERLAAENVDNLLGSFDKMSKVEKAQTGLRGVEFRIPFTEASYTPKDFNTLLAKGEELVGKGANAIPGMTTVKGVFDKIFLESKSIDAERMIDARANTILQSGYETDKLITRINKESEELLKGTDFKDPEDFRKAVAEYAVFRGTPERLMRNLDERIALKAQKTADGIEILQGRIEKARRMFGREAKRSGAGFDEIAGVIDSNESFQAAEQKWMQGIESAKKSLERFVKKETDATNELIQDVSKRLEWVNRYGELPEKLYQFLDKEKLIDRLDISKAGFLPLEASEEWTNYMKHMLTNEGRSMLETNKSFRELFTQPAPDKAGFLKPKRYLNISPRQMNEVAVAEWGAKGPLFVEDIGLLTAQRKLEEDVAMAHQRTLNALMELHGVEKPWAVDKNGFRFRATPQDGISFEKIFEKSGLTGFRNPATGEPVFFGSTSEAGIKNVLEQAGISKYVPEALYSEVTKIRSFKNNPEMEKFFRETVDVINGTYRSALTAIPAFIGQNVISNTWVNALAGVNPKYYPQAIKELAAFHLQSTPKSPLAWVWKKLNPEGVYNADEVGEAIGLGALRKTVTGESQVFLRGERSEVLAADQQAPLAAAVKAGEKVLKKIPGVGKYAQSMVDLTQFTEEVAKYAHYLSKTAEGLDPIAAGMSVKRYLFDYSDLTAIEKNVLKRFTLFYTFTRKNIPFAIQETFLNRAAYLSGRAIQSTQTDEFTPESIKEGSNVRLAEQTYLNVKDPLFEANLFSPQGQGIGRSADRVASMLTPALRIPLEAFSGRTFYQSKQGLPEITGNLPTARFTGFASELARSPAEALIGQTGLKYRELDPERTRLQVIRQRLSSLLSSAPDVTEIKDYRYNTDQPSDRSKQLFSAFRKANKSYSDLFK